VFPHQGNFNLLILKIALPEHSRYLQIIKNRWGGVCQYLLSLVPDFGINFFLSQFTFENLWKPRSTCIQHV
jgi:hypothetical protein